MNPGPDWARAPLKSVVAETVTLKRLSKTWETSDLRLNILMATSARERQSGMREGEGNGDGRICIGRYRASSFCFVLLGVTCLAISICGSHANPGDQDRTCKQGECNTRQIPEAVRTGLLSRVDGLLSAVDRVMDQTLDCLETLSAGIVGLRSKDADFKEAEETVQVLCFSMPIDFATSVLWHARD